MEQLFDILSHRRPHGSATEKLCIANHLDIFPKMKVDGFGNRIITIGKKPSVMFSCHTDTVHKDDGIQSLFIDDKREEVFTGSGDCLGADDGAGMWLMIQMIKSGKRGLYVFHRGEERGGLGSSYIRENTPGLLAGIDYCIAFDRKGYGDVITHQLSGRGCSKEFSVALSSELGGLYMPSDAGLFTDSDNYTDIIPECTNISVGYFDEHTAIERLDYRFLINLLSTVRNIDFESLPVIREPEADADFYGYLTQGYDDVPWDSGYEWDALHQWVCNNPKQAADVLMDCGYTESQLREVA